MNGGGILSENKRLILTCIVDAYPSVDSYQWYKNDQKINVSPLTSSYIVEKVSKDDTAVYKCLAKNTLKYSNGTTIEKSDQTQTRVTIECKRETKNENDRIDLSSLDAPMISSLTPIVAAESFALNVKLQCEIDSYPDSTIVWIYNDRQIFNSNKYSIVENQTSSALIIQQLQSNIDYGLYACNASNKLGKNSTTIQLRSKGTNESVSSIIFFTAVACFRCT